jgi:hypothetical protein
MFVAPFDHEGSVAVNSRRRMQVYRTMHSWHWISAAICLAALLLFCITGITLNHADVIGASPTVTRKSAQLDEELRAALGGDPSGKSVPKPLADWIEQNFDIQAHSAGIEWSPEELYVSAPGPGRDAWVSIDRLSGEVTSESTDRGWIAYFNDLHKGRNTGLAWKIFIDVVAAACVFFSLTGLVLLWIQARQRTATWPLVSVGVGVLVALMIVIAH